MNNPHYGADTIQATPRESALYQAGESIGAAKATDAAAALILETVNQLRAKFGGDHAGQSWLDAAANDIMQLPGGGKAAGLAQRRTNAKTLADAIRALGPAYNARVEMVLDTLSQCALNAQVKANEHREAFARQIATMPEPTGPNNTRQFLGALLRRAGEAVGRR